MVAETPPIRWGISTPALIGFVIAGIVAFGMINNLRKGDRDNT
jgi:hypothetical protein